MSNCHVCGMKFTNNDKKRCIGVNHNVPDDEMPWSTMMMICIDCNTQLIKFMHEYEIDTAFIPEAMWKEFLEEFSKEKVMFT